QPDRAAWRGYILGNAAPLGRGDHHSRGPRGPCRAGAWLARRTHFPDRGNALRLSPPGLEGPPRSLALFAAMRGIHERAAAQPTHPGALDWATVDLPNTWPDTYRLRRLMRLARSPLSRPRRVELPPGLPGAGTLPRYLLREFHNLPNGYYSHRVSTGYARLFDVIMVGTLRRARRQMAQRLAHLHSVLDVGCGAGQLASELERSGVPDVWG